MKGGTLLGKISNFPQYHLTPRNMRFIRDASHSTGKESAAMRTIITGLLPGGMAKTFSLILCVVLVSTVFSVPAKAVDDNGDYWTTKAPMPPSYDGGGPYRACAGAVVNGKVYVIGGYGTYGGHTRANQEYDPATDTWATKASM